MLAFTLHLIRALYPTTQQDGVIRTGYVGRLCYDLMLLLLLVVPVANGDSGDLIFFVVDVIIVVDGGGIV